MGILGMRKITRAIVEMAKGFPASHCCFSYQRNLGPQLLSLFFIITPYTYFNIWEIVPRAVVLTYFMEWGVDLVHFAWYCQLSIILFWGLITSGQFFQADRTFLFSPWGIRKERCHLFDFDPNYPIWYSGVQLISSGACWHKVSYCWFSSYL